jgi:hypothetical protein
MPRDTNLGQNLGPHLGCKRAIEKQMVMTLAAGAEAATRRRLGTK